jgi:hypothetical protein
MEAFEFALKQADLLGRVPRVAADDRLEPVALGTQRSDTVASPLDVGRQRELSVFALDVLFVGERDTDRR